MPDWLGEFTTWHMLLIAVFLVITVGCVRDRRRVKAAKRMAESILSGEAAGTQEAMDECLRALRWEKTPETSELVHRLTALRRGDTR